MRMANLADVKNELSRFVAQVRRGERVRILVRGVPAADLVPVQSSADAEGDQDADLAELEALGFVRRAGAALTKQEVRELERPGPKVRRGRAVAVLIAQRRER
jgi:prevent-host-death family protein